jgi:acyl carrier protein
VGKDGEVPEDQLTAQLIGFIRAAFLDGDQAGELTEETPLLAWGILNSFKTARLLSYIEDELGCSIPPADLYVGNFQDVRSIAAIVRENGGGPRASRDASASA